MENTHATQLLYIHGLDSKMVSWDTWLDTLILDYFWIFSGLDAILDPKIIGNSSIAGYSQLECWAQSPLAIQADSQGGCAKVRHQTTC